MTATPNEELLTIQVTVAMMALQALIKTHPNPEAVREVFDQLYGQFQSNALVSGAASPPSLAIARRMVDALFLD